MNVTIWHNPRCSKSRQTLKILQDQGIEPEIIEYLKQPPDGAEIRRVLDLLGIEPRQLMRSSEDDYNEQNLADAALDDAELITAMTTWPRIIQRPVVLANNKAAVGRPPEAVLDIL